MPAFLIAMTQCVDAGDDVWLALASSGHPVPNVASPASASLQALILAPATPLPPVLSDPDPARTSARGRLR